MSSHLRKVDHVTCVVRQDTIRQWAWFYIDVLGGVLTLRCDDTNPLGGSSMMVWTIEFAEFGIALIAGIDREEKSHVSAFVEKHGDHSFQHVAFQVSNLETFCAHVAGYGVNVLGDALARKDASGRYIKQVFGSPFHDNENSSVVGFYEFVERPHPDEDGDNAESAEATQVSFSEKAGKLLYEQAQAEMVEERRARMTRFSKMPPSWEVPEPRPDLAAQGPVEIVKRRGRRQHDAENLGEIHRWQSYRTANTRFPHARAAELDEMCRLVHASPGETIAEIGAGSGALTFRLASAVGAGGRLFTYDVSRDNLVSVMLSNDKGLPIIPVAQSFADNAATFPNEGMVDGVATLATFHHFDSRALRSGTRGREAAVAAFNRLLRRGGRLVIGDVADGTAAQEYFDAIDDPRYCHPNGHPHDFLTESSMRDLVRAAGFDEVVVSVREVPWVFASKADAIEFLSVMHNAQCPLDEVGAVAEKHLRFDETPERCVVRWELLFLEARKS